MIKIFGNVKILWAKITRHWIKRTCTLGFKFWLTCQHIGCEFPEGTSSKQDRYAVHFRLLSEKGKLNRFRYFSNHPVLHISSWLQLNQFKTDLWKISPWGKIVQNCFQKNSKSFFEALWCLRQVWKMTNIWARCEKCAACEKNGKA